MRVRKKSQLFEIAEDIARRTHAPFDIVWPILQEFTEVCNDTLSSGKDLRITRLGAFFWEKTPQKRYHNVNKGEMDLIPAGRRLRWRPPPKLRGVRSGKVRS